jgi:hypothetical protein
VRSTRPSSLRSSRARWIRKSHAPTRGHPFGGIDRGFPERGMPPGRRPSTFRDGLCLRPTSTTRGEGETQMKDRSRA